VDAQQLVDNAQRIIRHRRFQVDTYRPDLSRPPAQQ
jgi:hypothetical protein